MRSYTSPRKTFGFLGNNRIIFWFLGVVVVAGIIISGFFYNRHEIRISVDGKEIITVIRGGTVAESIQKAKVALGEKDIAEPPLQTKLTEDLKVKITRMVQVTLIADGQSTEHWVPAGNVEQTIRRLNVALNPNDQIVPEPETEIKTGDSIEVIRFSEKYIDEPVKIPFMVERRNDDSMEKGTTRIVRKGQEGLIQRTLKITLKNGQEIKREVIGEEEVRKPVNKIVAYGTVTFKQVSRGGTIRFSQAFNMTATAYTHTGNNTFSGIYPYRGTVAVDRNVIKLGTKLYVEGYGYATALDVGSAIRGNRIDLFFDTEKEARKWGRRQVKVYVLE